MKHLSLALHAVSLVAIAVLFYLVLQSPRLAASAADPLSDQPDSLSAQGIAPTAEASPAIVYVNTDSLLAHYAFFSQNKENLESRSRRAERDITSRTEKLEKEFMEAQQRAQTGRLTQQEAATLEQDLMKKQQELVQYRDRLTQNLMDEEAKLSRELNENIANYLRDFGRQRNYTFVLGYAGLGGSVLFATDSLDVTQEVLEGLNATQPPAAKK